MKCPKGQIRVNLNIDTDDYNHLFSHALKEKTTIQKILRQLIKVFVKEIPNGE